MNSRRFTPKKDYSTNRLQSGLLQLSAQTHLIVDETAMQPGRLEANGNYCLYYNYHRDCEETLHFIICLSAPNSNRFSKFFYWHTLSAICNNVVIKYTVLMI